MVEKMINKFIAIADKMAIEIKKPMQVIKHSNSYMVFPLSTKVPEFPLYGIYERVYQTEVNNEELGE